MKISAKIKTIILIIVVMGGLGYYILFKHIFSDPVSQEISSNVYVNGRVTAQTTIKIDGERVYSLLSDYRTSLLNYYGVFAIGCYECTCRDGTEAHIYGERYTDTQTIVYYQTGGFPNFEIDSRLLINRDMDEIAVGFADGTVIAASDELYQLYISVLQPRKE